MKRKQLKDIIIVCCMVGVLIGCNVLSAACAVTKPAATPSGDASTAQKATTRVGKTFAIQLVSNASTGYSWKVVSIANPKIAKFLKSAYTTSKVVNGRSVKKGDHPTTVVGAAGRENLSFKALARGTTKIVLGYVRSWEKGVKPVQTVTLTVTVK